MKKKQKYYVVWSGRKKGVFTSWDKCKESVQGFNQARFKSFEDEEEALKAFNNPYYDYFKLSKENKQNCVNKIKFKDNSQRIIYLSENSSLEERPIIDSLCVDAACSGNPGIMEYRGVYLRTGKTVFYYKHPFGTNNIGEFLAIVHGLSYLKSHNFAIPIYSDSVNAIKWANQKVCKTKLPMNEKNKDLFDYIHRAENWLKINEYSTPILKWNTEKWNEIPADFGRK